MNSHYRSYSQLSASWRYSLTRGILLLQLLILSFSKVKQSQFSSLDAYLRRAELILDDPSILLISLRADVGSRKGADDEIYAQIQRCRSQDEDRVQRTLSIRSALFSYHWDDSSSGSNPSFIRVKQSQSSSSLWT